MVGALFGPRFKTFSTGKTYVKLSQNKFCPPPRQPFKNNEQSDIFFLNKHILSLLFFVCVRMNRRFGRGRAGWITRKANCPSFVVFLRIESVGMREFEPENAGSLIGCTVYSATLQSLGTITLPVYIILTLHDLMFASLFSFITWHNLAALHFDHTIFLLLTAK